MAVDYEWDVETVTDRESEQHEEGEVLDHNHTDSYAEALSWTRNFKPEDGERFQIVLVRDDNTGRSWAYMKDGKLPEYFEDAFQRRTAKVPQRFHAEVARA
jgi:hypothetical protein